jgi:RimJ/RimL family protein N-acetyltransferase
MMETTLDALLADLSPRQRSGEYVLVVADKAKPVGDDAVLASVVEPEGRSLVLTRRDAERAGLTYELVLGWITLEVRSALDAVGLTAEVAVALGETGISCNVLAGYHHDHLLVPHQRVGEAIEVLEALSARYRRRLAVSEAGSQSTLLAGVQIRSVRLDEADRLLALKRRLDRESHFMLLEADERTGTARELADELRRLSQAPNSTLLVAEAAGELIGYVEATGGRYRRNCVTAEVVVGVVAAASDHGVGTTLLHGLDRWAQSAGLHRLELTVMAHNHAARRLYQRSGFIDEGRRRQCLLVDGSAVDEVYMAKLVRH